MSKFLTFNLLLSVLLLIQNIAFGQEVIISTPNEWVKKIDYPKTTEVSKYDISSGVYYKLIDYQSNFEEESQYYHFVQNILSSGGVTNASQLQIGYDTSYQALNFHQLIIWRKGKAINKTNEISFEYVKNEESLQSGIYSGLVTALVVIEDLRKNDLLEVSYTITGNNPVFNGAQYQVFPVEDVNPVDKVYNRVLYPSKEKYNYRCVGCEEEIIKNDSGVTTELTLERSNLDAVELEDTMPPWVIPYDYLEVSSTDSWKVVNAWALEVFYQNEDDKIDEVFKEIFYPEYTIEDKIDAIIDFVQDEIRYMGIESGIGSVKPFSPNQTIIQRFGDCKDKSLLMVSMLKKIGVEKSYPALVNSMMLGDVSQFLPSGYVFDHCIVYFKFENKVYWVDPTYSYQGGSFKDLVTFDYQKALVVKEGVSGLTEMKIIDKTSQSIVTEILDISSFDKAAELNVKGTLKGGKADYVRQFLEYYSKKELSESFSYYYGIIYPTLQEKQKLSIKENELENIFHTEESYTIENVWKEDVPGQEQNRTVTYEPANLYSYIYVANCKPKQYPVYFRYPARYKQKTIIKLPEMLSMEMADVIFNNVAFSYSQKIRMLDTKTIEILYDFESKTMEISPEDFPKVCSDINEIINNMSLYVSFPKTSFTFNKYQPNFNFNKTNQGLYLNNSFYYFPSSEIINSDSTSSIGIDLENSNEENQKQPEYPGGIEELYKHIDNNLEYPSLAKEEKLSGQVLVSFIVDKDGNLGSFEIETSLGSGCDEEAVRLIKLGEKWIPSTKKGETVDMKVFVPVVFKL